MALKPATAIEPYADMLGELDMVTEIVGQLGDGGCHPLQPVSAEGDRRRQRFLQGPNTLQHVAPVRANFLKVGRKRRLHVALPSAMNPSCGTAGTLSIGAVAFPAARCRIPRAAHRRIA